LCEYCRSSEQASGHYFEIDHVVPESKGGSTSFENLALACRTCNARKADRTEGLDPETGDTVALFNPRSQDWQDHFAWSNDGTRVLPLTQTGRATLEALQMNDVLIVGARAVWAAAGIHPLERN